MQKIGVALGILVFLICCGVGVYYFENYEGTYYTVIDNTKVEFLNTTDDMKYEYFLTCYNEKGWKKEIKFKTRRELREGSYIKLIVKSMGVHSWEEVDLEEIPTKVQEKLK